MSGPWEQYGPTPGPWSKYGTAPAPDLSLQVSPGGATSIPTQVEVMQVAGAPSPAMPAASAVGGGINATMADALKVIPMAAGGLADRLGLPSAAQDVPFSMVKALSDYADQEQAAAQAESKPGAIAGNVLGILPQLAGGEAALGARGESALVENAPRIAKIIEGMKHGLPLAALLGTEAANTNATNVINHGGDVPTAEKLFGTSLAANTAANVLPMGAFGNPLARALAGGAVNAAGGTGAQALEHMTAPDYVPAPTPASAAQQGGIGALLAMVLGHGGARPDMTAPGTEPAAAAAEPARAGPAPQLPPGADYTGDFTVGNPRPTVPPSPGPVAVTPAGEAFTPPQGLQTMADALAAAPKGKPALPPPTVAVDKAGTAMTTADQHTLATTEPPPQVASMLQALGLTPDVVRAQMAHPGMPRDNTQLNQALDMQSLLHPPALDNHPNAPGNNPTAPMPADNAPTAPKRAQVDTGRVDSRGRPIKVPALDYGRGDTLLHWLAANGGIDAAEMQRQTGLDPAATKDPAVMNPLGKVGMPALRRNGGMSTEQAFERMAQDGWFPGIDPNTPPAVGAQEVADMIHEALNGQKVFHPTEGHDQRIAAQFEEQMQQHQADQADMEGAARAEAAQALKARGIPPADHSQALTLAQLTSRAYDAGADPSQILDATFDGTPAIQARRLWDLTHQLEQAHGTDTRTSPRRGQDGAQAPAVGQAAARAGAADATANASGARSPAVDKFGRPKPPAPIEVKVGDNTYRIVQDYFWKIAKNDFNADSHAEVSYTIEKLNKESGGGFSFESWKPVSESKVPRSVETRAAEETAKTNDLASGKPSSSRPASDLFSPSVREPADLFADPTPAEKLKAEQARRDASRNGLGRDLVKPEQGAGELLAGKKPEQASIPAKVEQPIIADQTDTPAFRKWFGDSKVVDAEGKPLVVYHGTGNIAGMDSFKTDLTGQGNDQIGSGFYFTTDPSEASGYAHAVTGNAGPGARKLGGDESPGVASVYLNIKNPIRVEGANLRESGVKLSLNQVQAIIKRAPKLMDPEDSPIGDWHDIWGSGGVKPWMIADVAKHYVGENLLSLEGDFFRNDSTAFRHALADATGHDGVMQDFGNGKQHWVAWFPEQIKSATGNDGNFDAANPSIVRQPADGMLPEQSRRADWTPALDKNGTEAINSLVERYGGSTLADSIKRDFERQHGAALIGQTIKSHEDLAALAAVYRDPIFETARYMFVDDSGTVLGETAVSSRKAGSSIVFPVGEDDGAVWLIKAAPKGATGVWMVHNHPSGNPKPSDADLETTGSLGIALSDIPRAPKLKGHVVLDHDTFGRINASGEDKGIGNLPKSGGDPLRQRTGADLFDVKMTSPAFAASTGKQIAELTPRDSTAVVVMGAQGEVVSVHTFPNDVLAGPRGGALLSRLAAKQGGIGIGIVTSADSFARFRKRFDQASERKMLYDAVVVTDSGHAIQIGAHPELMAKRALLGKHSAGAIASSNSGVKVYEGADHLDTPTTEHDDSIPHRNPGESQADYARRLAGQSRADIKQALSIAKAQRDVSRLGLRAQWAKQDRQLAQADAAFKQYRVMFDKEDKVINLATIHQWETGQRITDADAREFFGLMKSAFDERTAKIQALAPDAMQQLIDHYMPHIWEDSGKATKWYQTISAKRPLQGDRSFLKQRTHATIKDGMATGLKPVSTNPVDLAILKLGQMDKFIAFHEFRQDLQRRGWVKRMEAGQRVPVGYARIDDPAFQIAGGLQGYHAVPELIAKDINNYLSPSLYRFGAWKALRAVENCLMSGRLGLSMFHGGFTTMDNIVMHADVAGRRMLQGDLTGGLAALLKAPASIVWSPYEGGKLNKQWLGLRPTDGHTAAILDMLEQGGARMKMSPTDYNNAIPKLVKAYRQKEIGGTLRQTLPALGEAISWHIHHKLVPAQKMAARVMLAKFELDRVAGALGKARGDYSGIINAMHPDALKQIAAHVVNLVDDRLGQMNYDNQFWNKTARESAQAIIGAVGWQVGTLRTVTGGVRDLSHLWKPEKLLSSLDKEGKVQGDMGRVSGRLTYLLSLGLLMGSLSAITQYLMTGEGPSEIKDYFYPKTGNKNADGSSERLQWPSYWSDHYKLATHPLTTAMHKINPLFSMVMEALANQDYYGVEVRHEDDSWWKQAGEVGAHMAKGFVPYSVTGADKLQGDGVGIGRQVANFVGITRAPASVSRTAFQAFVAEKAYDAIPKGSRTQAEADHTKAMHHAEDQLRRGEQPDMTGLTAADRRNVDKAARMEVPAIRFKRLGLEDKLRAYDMATPKERKQYDLAAIILRSNWHKTVAGLPADEQDAVLSKIQALTP